MKIIHSVKIQLETVNIYPFGLCVSENECGVYVYFFIVVEPYFSVTPYVLIAICNPPIIVNI